MRQLASVNHSGPGAEYTADLSYSYDRLGRVLTTTAEYPQAWANAFAMGANPIQVWTHGYTSDQVSDINYGKLNELGLPQLYAESGQMRTLHYEYEPYMQGVLKHSLKLGGQTQWYQQWSYSPDGRPVHQQNDAASLDLHWQSGTSLFAGVSFGSPGNLQLERNRFLEQNRAFFSWRRICSDQRTIGHECNSFG
ncbi:MAG: hypothetical protein LR015_01020 [Verrucomicrobia bacterium]|nr:hypothetical protein [Verrucomicrobiota bacterium]